jgi:hypothetical protein
MVLSGLTRASSTTKTGHHDIAEILLKVALKHTKKITNRFVFVMPAVIIPKKWANVTYLLHIYYIFDRSK